MVLENIEAKLEEDIFFYYAYVYNFFFIKSWFSSQEFIHVYDIRFCLVDEVVHTYICVGDDEEKVYQFYATINDACL